MSKYSIALDVDEVLRQWYPAMCKRFNQPCEQIDIWSEEEAGFLIKNFHIIENNKRFWMNLERLSRPEDINFDIDYYITSSPRLMENVTRDWIYTNGFPRRPVIITKDKPYEMRRLGVDVLVDDNVHTLDKVVKSGKIGIQFVPPYMRVIREDLNPITHLSEIPAILDKIGRR